MILAFRKYFTVSLLIIFIAFSSLVFTSCDRKNGSINSSGGVAGKEWNMPELIETNDAGDADSPQIVVDWHGNAIAVWIQDDGTRKTICSNRYTYGIGWGTTELIKAETVEWANFLQVGGVEPNGNAVAVWHQDDVAGITSIWSNRYIADTGTWGTARRIGWDTAEITETKDTGDRRFCMTAANSNGNAITVWRLDDGTGNISIWSSYYTFSTDTWEAAEPIETSVTGVSHCAQVAIGPDGNAVAVWTRNNGTRGNIWSNRYTIGTGWGTAEMIEADNGDALDPQVDVGLDGNAIAVWIQYDGTRYNVWSSRFD